MFIESVVKSYIDDQWVNKRIALNEPQAREELLCAAQLFFFEVNSDLNIYCYKDEDFEYPNTIPLVADSWGKFPDIYLKYGEYTITLKNRKGDPLVTLNTDQNFEL